VQLVGQHRGGDRRDDVGGEVAEAPQGEEEDGVQRRGGGPDDDEPGELRERVVPPEPVDDPGDDAPLLPDRHARRAAEHLGGPRAAAGPGRAAHGSPLGSVHCGSGSSSEEPLSPG
jgi:hypothetical protein